MVMSSLPAFSTKKWKAAALASYISAVVGVLFVTATVPVSIMLIFQQWNLQSIAQYSYSFRKFQHWILAPGLAMFLVGMLGVIASMTRKKGFKILVMIAMIFTNVTILILLLVGMVVTEGKKNIFQGAWDSMDDDVKSAIQNYFLCCGFESPMEWNVGVTSPPDSCYAVESESITWPSGCYNKLSSLHLGKVSVMDSSGQTLSFGQEMFNPLYTGFLCSFLLVLLVQSVATVAFLVAIYESNRVSLTSEVSLSESTDAVSVSNYSITEMQEPKIEENDNSKSTTDNSAPTMTNGKVTDKANNIPKARVAFDDSDPPEKEQCHRRFTNAISYAFSDAFFWLGFQVAKHPKMTIMYSLILIGAFSAGILQRYEPADSNAVAFLSEENEVILQSVLQAKAFVLNRRNQYILVVDNNNVLSADSFNSALTIDQSVKSLTSSTGETFSSICLQAGNECRQRSLFELWNFNTTAMQSLTAAQILSEINQTPLTSPAFNETIDINHILGGLHYSGSNEVSSANAHLLHYVTTRAGGNWENLFIDLARSSHGGVNVYVEARSSQSQEGGSTTEEDLPLLFAGFGLVFIYIILMTGKLSLLEHRAYVALMGVTSAGLSMGAGIGLTPSFGLKWTVLHLIVPFLVIGIGVDDMFVILQAWNSVNDDPKLKDKSIEEKSGHVLKIAGTSITITSITDLVAFAVGATSLIGAFASFSIFVASCIIILFFLQCTFFMACVVLDEKRKVNRYDSCLACCYKHKDSYKPGKCSERELFQTFFEDVLGRLITKLPFAIIIILCTLALTGVMAWGFYQLKVEYDPNWYLPPGSYLLEYRNQYDKYFKVGSEASIYVIGADFYTDREKLHTLYLNLQSNSDLNTAHTKSWFEDFVSWLASEKGISNPYSATAFTSATDFYTKVREYLAGDGSNYEHEVQFRSGVIIGSRFDIRHRLVTNEVDNADIMTNLQKLCDQVGFSAGDAFPYGRWYLVYEINRIIREEVYRNLGITLACVFVMILPILASLQMAIWVGLCVAFTTVDVAGSMFFAGFSIETSTIITLLLSIGLAVDYAAHVGHSFLTMKGSRKLRARVSVGRVGLAVFNGGFSTFLALSLLSVSQNYAFRVFFTVFVCVVGFGLWNGLFFLPSLLMMIGPAPHANAIEARLSSRHEYKKNKEKLKEKDEIDTEVGYTTM